MQDGRWTTVTPSQFDHERVALEHVRRLLPDAEPYRAWSNFTFTADTGHVYEVDLLVATRAGLFLVEIKSLNGRLTNSGPNWIAGNHDKIRTFDNPLHLADLKAKRLRSLLDRQAAKQGLRGSFRSSRARSSSPCRTSRSSWTSINCTGCTGRSRRRVRMPDRCRAWCPAPAARRGRRSTQ